MARILIIAPHMDDEVLGCGGTIARHVDQGDRVDVCVICNRAYSGVYNTDMIEEEKTCAKTAQGILGYAGLRFLDMPDERLSLHFQELLRALDRTLAEVQPELIYTSFGGDLHQDHQTVARASNIALRSFAVPFIRRVLAYEVPSDTEQVFPGVSETFIPTVFLDISVQLDRKLSAMAAYERESRGVPHPRSQEILRARAQVRGGQCGRFAAEAFMLMREVG